VDREIDLLTVSEEDWAAMLAAASELDLVHGGYFRARQAGILFYASPENAPEDWGAAFAEGSPEVPRALVGEGRSADGTKRTA